MNDRVKAGDVLAVAASQIGTTEIPVNQVTYNDWYYGRHVSGANYPWCRVFLQWCFNRAGMPLPVRTASCSVLISYAKSVHRWVTSDYKAGDVFFVQTEYGKHTGIIRRVYENGCNTIEGNLLDAVHQNYRTNEKIIGAYRPDYVEESDMTYEETKNLILQLVPGIVDEILVDDREAISAAAPGDWSKVDREWAQQNGLIVGDSTGMHWKNPATREQLAAILHRFADMVEGEK